MIVGSTTDQAITIALHPFGKGFCIFDNLLLVRLEGWLQRLLETDRLCRNHMHERTALDARERLGIDFLRVFLFAHNQPAARTAQRFVRRSGYKISVLDRTRMFARDNQAGNMCNVGEKIRPNFTSDLAHALEINDARISAGANRDHLGLMLPSHLRKLIVIDAFIVFSHSVMNDFEEFTAEIGLIPM